jgi:1,4-alpha-glucan branching enzyme
VAAWSERDDDVRAVRQEPVAVTAPTQRGGMGAIPFDGGVAFRVWAPFAAGVTVVGDFNGWSADADPLAPEGNGYWSADRPGARPGQQYRFLVHPGGEPLSRNDPYARELTHSAGNSIIYEDRFDWGPADFRMPPWDQLVVYELHVGTFNDEPGGAPGGFAGVANRLDYLRDLGVTALELLPSAEFATDFSWGYNPSHIFAVERAYGGPDELKRLVRAAHERGLAVFADVVYNHLGPGDLDLWQFDGWTPNGNGGIYFYNDHRRQTPWGDTRPDYGRPEVVAFLRDNVRMWLEEFRLDGLRWDATAYIRNVYGSNDPAHDIPDGWRLLQTVTSDTAARQPWKLHVAEDLQGVDAVTRPPDEGGAGFGSQWDAGFVHPVRSVLTAAMDGARNMADLRTAVLRGAGSPWRRVIYTESHDEVANGKTRLPAAIAVGDAGNWYARKRSTLGAVLVFTSPGIPMIFQGQEFLEDRWFHDEHPIDWKREHTYAGILALYRDLIRLRRNWFDTTRGLRGPSVNVHHVNDDDNVLAFHRWDRGGPRDDVVVVLNVANRSYEGYRIGMPRAGPWRVRFNSDHRGYSDDFGGQPVFDTATDDQPADGMPWSARLGLPAYSAVVLSQDA